MISTEEEAVTFSRGLSGHFCSVNEIGEEIRRIVERVDNLEGF